MILIIAVMVLSVLELFGRVISPWIILILMAVDLVWFFHVYDRLGRQKKALDTISKAIETFGKEISEILKNKNKIDKGDK